MVINTVQFTDPVVTRHKYIAELQKFQDASDHYRQLGILLTKEVYPDLFFAFAVPSLQPAALLFGVRINFINYDAVPLSVKFIHPLTFEPLLYPAMPSRFKRRVEGQQPQDLLQPGKGDDPFICIPGVREFHDHPFHTGESWFLIRAASREGTLCFILDNLYTYGISAIKSYQLPLQLLAQSAAVNVLPDVNNLPA
jgi:hypothetical protein